MKSAQARHVGLRQLAAAERPIVSAAAHDALSARLIAQSGFKALTIGGSSMLAARYGLPDVGLGALGEMVEGARDIVAATSLPCIIDGDDGYGDVKSVSRTITAYERLGVAGVVLEDQARDIKQPGAQAAQGVVPEPVFEAKLRAAIAARSDPDLVIIARTDAYALEGIDGALRRAENAVRAGADGILITGIASEKDVRKAGEALRGCYHMIVLTEGGRTPLLKPSDLHAMGYSHVAYPSFLMLRMVRTLVDALAELQRVAAGASPELDAGVAEKARASLMAAVELKAWQEFERRFPTQSEK